MSEFYIIFARKKFLLIVFGGGGYVLPSPTPIATAHVVFSAKAGPHHAPSPRILGLKATDYGRDSFLALCAGTTLHL